MLFDYTVELRRFFESVSPNTDGTLSHAQVIENGRTKLFDFDFPIFDEAYRATFETHFIRNFYMRQIGFETFGLFKFQLETWLLIHMPYWNKVFESELITFDPLTNTKIDLTHNKRNDNKKSDAKSGSDTSTTNSSNHSTSNQTRTENNDQSSSSTTQNDSTNTKTETNTDTVDNFNRDLESNIPDQRLALTATDGQGVIEYASNIKEHNENNSRNTTSNSTDTVNDSSRTDTANKETNTETNSTTDDGTNNVSQTKSFNDTTTSTINNVEDYIEYRFGKEGSQTFSSMVNEYRSSLMRVEKQLFREMNELFMLVY